MGFNVALVFAVCNYYWCGGVPMTRAATLAENTRVVSVITALKAPVFNKMTRQRDVTIDEVLESLRQQSTIEKEQEPYS